MPQRINDIVKGNPSCQHDTNLLVLTGEIDLNDCAFVSMDLKLQNNISRRNRFSQMFYT